MKKIKLLVGLIALSTLNIANAATASAPMQVTATVAPKCVLTAFNIAFGTIQLGGSGTSPQSQGMVAVECTKSTSFSISFDGGLNGVASPNRRLKHASLNEYIDYSLGIPLAPPGVPFNQTAFSGTGNGIGVAGSTISVPITATINPNANVSSGNYSDTVSVTVTY
jgi:spore coat protein U-like protein